jgi:hypothetical protein
MNVKSDVAVADGNCRAGRLFKATRLVAPALICRYGGPVSSSLDPQVVSLSPFPIREA